jgi:predicted RNA-binding protein with PIN domain
MEYWIDGYNLLFRLEKKKGLSLEKRRERFIETLNQKLSSFKGKIKIVFDSAEQLREVPQLAKLAHLEVIYTPRGSSADAYLIELVDQCKNPKVITVVTSDTGLATQCQHLGAKTLSVEGFLALIEKRQKREIFEEKPGPATQKEVERLTKIFEKKFKGE